MPQIENSPKSKEKMEENKKFFKIEFGIRLGCNANKYGRAVKYVADFSQRAEIKRRYFSYLFTRKEDTTHLG